MTEDEIREECGIRIWKARRDQNLTQEELAGHMGRSRASVANVEAGRQNLTLITLFRFADTLGIPPADLLPTGGASAAKSAKIKRASKSVAELEDKLERAKARRRKLRSA